MTTFAEDPATPTAEPLLWHATSGEEVVAWLQADSVRGLTDREAESRLQRYGPNQLAVANVTSWVAVLARQFWDVLTLILLIAALLSVVAGEAIDAVTILAIVVLNGTLGFAQEWKAERALAALRQMLSPSCTVIRDGSQRRIETRLLVPGDLVQLEAGDHVPADLRVVVARNLRADESTLTGESDSVAKETAPSPADTPLAEQASMAWMGTTITNGRARGLVVATGTSTQFGKISQLTELVDVEATPLQRKMAVLGRQLGIAAIAIAIGVCIIGWAFGNGLTEMFMVGVSLAVAVVPEGLPAVVTMTMALGIRAMVRRKALLRRLQAAESLGAATVICTDKTGTLTQNQMTVTHIWLPAGQVEVTGVGYDPAGHFEQDHNRIDYQQRTDLLRLLESGMRCNHATLRQSEQGWVEIGEPTEGALVVAGYKAWLPPSTHADDVAEFEFDSTRKRMTVITRERGQLTAHVKGAPEIVLQRCTAVQVGDDTHAFAAEERLRVDQAISALANQGLRTLALARRELAPGSPLTADEVERDLTLLGIVGMLDPPRPEVPTAVKRAQSAGIRIIMITGDSAATATAIGQAIGLASSASITGTQLDELDDAELLRQLQGDSVFARTTPEHKLRIVTALQGEGHIVGMTGDGVNDAPALKKADIGIAMGLRGTDVAKGASDMVLTDDNFSSIVGAIEEGRRQYDNIQKFVRYLLSSNTGEVIAIVSSILMRGPLMLLPVQILWMNLVTDGLSAIALGVEPAEAGVMKRPPRDTRSRVIDRQGLMMILLLGGYVGFATLTLFSYYLYSADPARVAVAQTVAFTGIIVIQKMNVFNFRFLDSPMGWRGFWTNPWVLAAVTFSLLLQVAALHVPLLQTALHTQPLAVRDWGLIALVAAPVFIVCELAKRLVRPGKPRDD